MQLLLQERERHRVGRDDGLGVLDEVAELAVAVLTEGRVQADGLTAVLLDLDDLLRRHVQLERQLLGRGLAAQVLQHLTLHTGQLVDDLDHVHRDADGASLVGHGARDGLTDPPGGVGRELEALGVVELLDRTDQTEVALLDQVEEEHAAAGVALGQRDHEAQVGLEQVVLGPTTVDDDPVELLTDLLGDATALGELLLGEQAGLDALGQLDLLTGGEQRDLADLLEVVLDRVGRGAGDHDLLDGLVGLVGRRQREAGLLVLLQRRVVLEVLDELLVGDVRQDLLALGVDLRGLACGGHVEDLGDVDRLLGGLLGGGLLGRSLLGGRLLRLRGGRGLAGRGLLGGSLLRGRGGCGLLGSLRHGLF